MQRPTNRMLVIAGLILAFAASAVAQQPRNANPGATVVFTHVTRIPSPDGSDNFQQYCVPCHGADAKGTGPAARALDVPPADLTLIAVRHGGTYDRTHIWQSLRENHEPVPGSDMPNWEHVLRSVCRSDAQVQLRLTNLVRYLESIQQR